MRCRQEHRQEAPARAGDHGDAFDHAVRQRADQVRAVFAGHLASEGYDDQHDQQSAHAGDPRFLHGEAFAAIQAGGEDHIAQHHGRGADRRQQACDRGDHMAGDAVAERTEHHQQHDHRQRGDDRERNRGRFGGVAVHHAGNQCERHQHHGKSDFPRGFLGGGLLSGHLGPPFHIVVNTYAI